MAEIYIHGRGDEKVDIADLPLDSPVGALAQAVTWGADGTAEVSREDAEDVLQAGTTLEEAGISDGSHVHVHRSCREVDAVVVYNGLDHRHKYLASKRVERVLEWALEAFGVPSEDRTGWHLEYGNPPKIAQPDLHLGDLPITSACTIEFALGRDAHIQG